MEALQVETENSASELISIDESLKSENISSETVSVSSKEEHSKILPQKSSCKALSDGHSSVKAKLQRASSALLEKEAQLKNLEEDITRQREKTFLLEERIRLMTEKLCGYKRCLERKEKKQDNTLLELADIKWKVQEARKFFEKMNSDYSKMESMKKERQNKFAIFTSKSEYSGLSTNEQLKHDINKLSQYKLDLKNGDVQMCSILNGNKMIELEQRKHAMRDAIEERMARSEALYVEIDEKTERVQELKKALEDAKKQHQDMLRDRKNHCAYLTETELRLQRSLDYLRAKIDYGTYVPAPWPNVRESLKFKT